MDSRSNADRASEARVGIDAYACEVRQSDEDLDTNAGDLLASMMHLLGAERFADALRRGRMHYDDEKN